MPIDANIALGVKPLQIDSPVNQMSQIMQMQGLQQSNQLNQLKMQQAQTAQDRTNKMYSIMGALPADATDEQRSAALKSGGFFDQADVVDKNVIARNTQKSEGQAKMAEALAKFGGVQKDLSTAVMASPTIENANIALDRASQYHKMLGFGDLDTTAEKQALAGMTSPEQIKQWAAGHALNAEKLLPQNVNFASGDVHVNQSINPITGQVTKTGNTVIGQSADNKATIAKDYGIEAIKQKGENLRAGFDASGNPTGDMETTAKAIASGQLPPPSGMALTNPKNQRILARVMEINPQYDFTDVTAKKKAASDFTSGNQGNALRSFAVAGQHLDQLGALADALNNGNMQIVNKLGNAYAAQTGSPAPTDFNAAKDVVAKEVMKAIVGGGGGVAEREELAKSMSQANSPAQLKGVIAQYRGLMGAQHDALLQQRRAAGLSDSTLPKYSVDSTSQASTPPDIAALLAKHGGK